MARIESVPYPDAPFSTIRSSLKNTVSPAGTIKFLTMVFVAELTAPAATKFNVSVQLLTVSSVRSGVPVLHTIILLLTLHVSFVYI